MRAYLHSESDVKLFESAMAAKRITAVKAHHDLVWNVSLTITADTMAVDISTFLRLPYVRAVEFGHSIFYENPHAKQDMIATFEPGFVTITPLFDGLGVAQTVSVLDTFVFPYIAAHPAAYALNLLADLALSTTLLMVEKFVYGRDVHYLYYGTVYTEIAEMLLTVSADGSNSVTIQREFQPEASGTEHAFSVEPTLFNQLSLGAVSSLILPQTRWLVPGTTLIVSTFETMYYLPARDRLRLFITAVEINGPAHDLGAVVTFDENRHAA